MADIQIVRLNEKLKAVSAMGTNASLLVATAVATRWFVVGVDGVVLAWLAGSILLAYMSINLLSLMQAED